MKNLFLTAFAGLLASTTILSADGWQRTSRSVGMIFEQGTHAELSFSMVTPKISGTDPATLQTLNMANQSTLLSGGYKTDLNDKLSVAVIIDQPFGSDLQYTGGFYSGSRLKMRSNAVTLLASYDLTNRFAIFGGGVAQKTSLQTTVPFVGAYSAVADSNTGYGFVLGAAYQIPEKDFRVAVTYHSKIDTKHDTLEYGVFNSTTNISTPKSVNLEFQSGINPKTMVLGSVRWAAWSKFQITPANYPLGNLISFSKDTITYNLGVERKVSDKLSLALSLSYEKSQSLPSSFLIPSSGYFGVGIGATYKIGDNTRVSGNIKYMKLGDVTGAAGTFANNHATTVGIKIAHTF